MEDRSTIIRKFKNYKYWLELYHELHDNVHLPDSLAAKTMLEVYGWMDTHNRWGTGPNSYSAKEALDQLIKDMVIG
jgi:hypothetical protein